MLITYIYQICLKKRKKIKSKKAEIEKIQRDIDATINDFELDDEF